ncbi:MAG: DM13 domain-containing protein [Bacteroidota bacterium]
MRSEFLKSILHPTGLVILLALFQACVGTDHIDDLSPESSGLEVISPNALVGFDSINVGDTIAYGARYRNEAGQEEEIDVLWSSSNANVASIDAAGRAVGQSEGASMILVTGNGLTAERLLLVSEVERVEVNAPQSFLLVNDQLPLTATYFDAEGTPAPATFTWASSNPAIATVDGNGVVTGVADGEVTITASANGKTSKGTVLNVLDNSNQVAQVVISAPAQQVEQGAQLAFSAVVTNANGDPVTDKTITWNSSNPSLLSINSNGVATGNGLGLATITATVDGITSNGIEVLVTPVFNTSRSGNFKGTGGYSVSGNVVAEVAAGGDLRLNFSSDFSSSNGPGLYVYLSNNTNGGVEVAKLNQLSGPFTLDVPGVGLNDYDFVLIWCKPFGVTFGYAELN